MDYNNMNRRASRSAYNYDNDRNSSRRRIDNGRRKEENADFQDFRRKPRNDAPGRPSAQQKRPVQTPQQNRPRRPMASAPAPERAGHNGAPQRKAAPARNTAQRPQSSNKPKKRPETPKKQPQKRDWIYPEGYTPPQMQRRPQGQRRPQSGNAPRRQPPRKAAPPRPRIDWYKIGAVICAVLLRFTLCCVATLAILGLIYHNTFYSEIEPKAKTVTYSFQTVSGEGEDKKITSSDFEADGAYAYCRKELLVNFSEISKWLGTAQVGDVYSMRFVLGGKTGSENVVFHNSSQNAFVNGAPVVMKCAARFDKGEVWVPVSFVRDYITGIEITASDDSVTLNRNESELSFTLRPSAPLVPAEQPEENDD